MTTRLDDWAPGAGLSDFWLSVFPDWPVALIEKFAVPIVIDLYRFHPSAIDPAGFAPWWGQVVSAAAQANYSMPLNYFDSAPYFNFNLLNPSNTQFYALSKFDPYGLYGTQQTAWVGLPFNPAPNANLTDYRNFEQDSVRSLWPHITMGYDTRLYYDNFQWNWAVGGTAGSIYQTQKPFIMSSVTVLAVDYSPYLVAAPNASAKPYAGVDTIWALHQNGADNGGVDYAVLADYIDYRNAILKFGQQLAAQKAADLQQQKNEISDYKNELADKLQAEKNSLQNLQLSMKQAMTNEAASAARDMAQTFLAAQNLKLSLLQAMK